MAAVCTEIFKKLVLKNQLLEHFTKVSRKEPYEIVVKDFRNRFSNPEVESLTIDPSTLFSSNPLNESIVQEYMEDRNNNFAGHDAPSFDKTQVPRILKKINKEKELLDGQLEKSVSSFKKIFFSALIFLDERRFVNST